MTRIAIVAALPAELAPLVKNWQRSGAGEHIHAANHPTVYTGQTTLPDNTPATLYAAAAGMGPSAATQAFAAIQTTAQAPLDAIVSYGWAGALSCGVKPPDLFHISEVIDTRTGERFPTAAQAQATPLRLITLDHVARADEKRPLAERYHAVLVDMEAATIARLARTHSIPFLCVKAISDGYLDILPDFNRFLDAQGQLRLPAFVAHSLLRPRYWGPLFRLGLNSRAAAQNLASGWAGNLPACLRRAGLLSYTS